MIQSQNQANKNFKLSNNNKIQINQSQLYLIVFINFIINFFIDTFRYFGTIG